MKHLLSPLNLLTFLLLTTGPLLMAQSSATFNGPEDATTQGNWTGHYGSDGYFIAGGGSISPSYASVSLYGDTVYPWGSASSADGPRALQVSSGASTYLPAAFVASNSFTINVDVTDGGSHNVALYLLDWDSGGQRAETVSVEDAATSTVLATAVGPNTLTNLNKSGRCPRCESRKKELNLTSSI